MENLKSIVARVDYRRLSGVRSLLGVELEPGSAYVVELRRHGNPLDAVSGKIEAARSFRCALRSNTPEESGQALKAALIDFGIQTAYAVVSPSGARYVSAVIPPEIENVTEWVEENAASLIHLPVSPSELMFHIDIVKTDTSGQRALVTFMRKGEIDNTVKLAAVAGLSLLSIRHSLQCLIPVCALSQLGKLPPSYEIAHLSHGTLSTLSCQDGRVFDIKVDHVTPDVSLPEVIERASAAQGEEDIKVFASGAFEKSQADQALIRPFGLTSDFALASGLALSGILPNGNSANFLPQKERDRLELNLSRSLLKRAALVSGLVLFTALALPLALSSYVSMKSDQIDESISNNGGSVGEIESMEKEASVLRESARNYSSPENRSNSSYALHEIAKLMPKGIRLLSLVLQADGPSLVLKGEGESQRVVSELMRSLKSSPLCRELSLKKLDTGGTSGSEVRTKRGRVYFEIALQFARGRSI